MSNNYKQIENDKLFNLYPKIHQSINKYYPVGFEKNSKEFNSYSGIKLLNREIENNIVNLNNYKKIWTEGFIEKLKLKLSHTKIYDSTLGMVPNLSGIINLSDKINKNNRIELHFYISLINNYYTIEILDINTKKEIEHPVLGKKTITSIDNIIVSPMGYYKKIFLDVEEAILENFQSSKFIPYLFSLIEIKGLKVQHRKEENVTISNALFQKYSSYNESITILGDINYKINEL